MRTQIERVRFMEFFWDYLLRTAQLESCVEDYLNNLKHSAHVCIDSVTPINTIDCIAKLHSLDLKASLVDFYLNVEQNALNSNQWLHLIDGDYQQSYQDMVGPAEPSVEHSLIYKLYPNNCTKTCLWDLDMENHLSNTLRLSSESLIQRHASIIDYYSTLQNEALNITNEIAPVNFIESYLKLKQIDAKLFYLFSIPSLYKIYSSEEIVALIEEESQNIVEELVKFYWNDHTKKYSLLFMFKESNKCLTAYDD